jgi:hypothetical protein
MAQKRQRTRVESDRRDKQRAQKLTQVRRRISERAAEAARRTGLGRS